MEYHIRPVATFYVYIVGERECDANVSNFAKVKATKQHKFVQILPEPRIFTASDSLARIDRLLRLLGRCYILYRDFI